MRERVGMVLAVGVFTACLVVGCRDEQEQALTATDWVTSEDGVLSLCLLAMAPVARDELILLQIELRNNTDDALLVRSPFSRGYKNWFAIGITTEDGRQIRYEPKTVPGSTMRVPPASILPGEVLHDESRLPENIFPGIDRRGIYTIVYTYRAYEQDAIETSLHGRRSDIWLGEIRSEPITVRRR